jgi:hypothetical protein
LLHCNIAVKVLTILRMAGASSRSGLSRRWSMSDIALHETTTGALQRLIEGWRRLLLGIGEGMRAARRYERLAALSDAELARRGLSRTDLPWLAFSGQPPASSAVPEGTGRGR